MKHEDGSCDECGATLAEGSIVQLTLLEQCVCLLCAFKAAKPDKAGVERDNDGR